MCGRRSSRRIVLIAAYAPSGSGVRGLHHRDLGPRLQLRRRHVVPRLAAVDRDVNQPIVGPHPDAIDVERRRRDRVDDASLRRLCRGRARVLADVRRDVPRLPRQVGADLRPAVPAGRGLPQRCSRRSRACADRLARRAPAASGRRGSRHRPADLRRDLHDLTGPAVVSRELAAVDDVGVQRVRRNVAVLLDADGMPFAKRDAAVVAAALHARRAALLLPAADAIGKRVVGADVVELRGRLVVPRAPASRRRSR